MPNCQCINHDLQNIQFTCLNRIFFFCLSNFSIIMIISHCTSPKETFILGIHKWVLPFLDNTLARSSVDELNGPFIVENIALSNNLPALVCMICAVWCQTACVMCVVMKQQLVLLVALYSFSSYQFMENGMSSASRCLNVSVGWLLEAQSYSQNTCKWYRECSIHSSHYNVTAFLLLKHAKPHGNYIWFREGWTGKSWCQGLADCSASCCLRKKRR